MRRVGLILALGFAITLAPALSRADGPAPPSADNVKAAGQHFQKARDLYQSGSYREAVAELEVALALDPTAKDLVYNLGVLSEKLNRIDDSIKYFKRYLQMDLDASERVKAEGFIKRLEGAKKEVREARDADDDGDTRGTKIKPIDSRPPPPPTSRGAVTGVLVAGTVLAVIGIGVGSVMGAKAISDRPAAGMVTGAGLPYSTLASQEANAHTEAMVADVALGIGIVAAVTTFVLYVGTRPRAPIYLSQHAAPKLVGLSPLVNAHTGGFALAGSF